MHVLTNPTAEELRAAWERSATFALLPDKAPVGGDDVLRRAAALPAELREDHFVLLTSGSTGEPKLLVGSRARAAALSRAIHEAQDNGPAAAALLALPLTYSFAFVNQFVWAVEHERALIPTPGLADPKVFAEILATQEDAMLCLVGVQGALLPQALPGRTFPGVTRLHFAGGRFPQEHLARLGELFPQASITNNYGCAEAMPRLTVRPAEAAADGADVGRPLPGIELRIGDDDAVEFRSEYGAVALLHADDTEDLRGRWVATGDRGRLTPEGSLVLIGRANEVFKRHGEKVSVPAVLATVERASGCSVGAFRAVDRQGESGWVLVLAPVPDRSEVRSVLTALRAAHPRAQWPLRIAGRDEIPLSPNGKVDVEALGSAPGEILWDQRA